MFSSAIEPDDQKISVKCYVNLKSAGYAKIVGKYK